MWDEGESAEHQAEGLTGVFDLTFPWVVNWTENFSTLSLHLSLLFLVR